MVGLAIVLSAFGALGEEAAEGEIRALESQIADAIVGRDTAFVERLFGADFSYIGVRGEVKTKADIVAELKAGDLVFESLKFDDLKVRLFGETAVVTGIARTKGRSPQGPISGEFRYTRIYVRRDAAWQLVAFQGTPLVAAAPK